MRHKVKEFSLLFVLLIISIALFACGGDGGGETATTTQVSTVVDNTGGVVTFPERTGYGETRLEIPPGALDEATEITISVVENRTTPEGSVIYQL